MALDWVNEHNFHMGVHYMDMFRDDAATEDVIEALRVLSEFLTYNDLGGDIDRNNTILASKAIDVAYTALAYPACTEYGLNLNDCIEELHKELEYNN